MCGDCCIISVMCFISVGSVWYCCLMYMLFMLTNESVSRHISFPDGQENCFLCPRKTLNATDFGINNAKEKFPLLQDFSLLQDLAKEKFLFCNIFKKNQKLKV